MNRIRELILENSIKGEYLEFSESCHSAEEAARAANADINEVVKNVCLIGNGKIITAIVRAVDRVSTTAVGKILGIERPRTATPEEILEKTGYPAGGVPSFGHDSVFLIDEKVMEKENIYTSGGTENSLVRIAPAELQKANNGKVARIRK